jgi:uncharacterized protein
VVALVGARQVGKTTLARRIGASHHGIHLDLERPSDLARLAEPELYLQAHADRLVVLDEIQRSPELFPLLRSLVDEDRRPGRFLVLGSASPDLLRQSSESLAGRIVYHELCPVTQAELDATPASMRRLWLRGGFPPSLLAVNDAASLEWREAFIQTHLERDIPGLGLRVAPPALRRFWQMLAHSHGQLWNAAKIAAAMEVTAPTIRHYLDILEQTFMLRRLLPWHGNLKKRLVKAPKVYLRDSGLLHALLGLPTLDDLMGHPGLGSSWEGWVIEQVLALAPSSWRPSFYRTGAGAEIDLLLERPGKLPPLALEIKHSLSPTPSRGFRSALEDLGLKEGLVICPVPEPFPLGKGISTLPVNAIPSLVGEKSSP